MSKFIVIFYLCVLIHNANLMYVSYYELLGISKHSSTLEIKQAYKKLAVKYHPDKNSDEETQEVFLLITEAYETLKDPEKRRKYDIYDGSHETFTWDYDDQFQSEHNNLYSNGLYNNDSYVVTLSSSNFYAYLTDGFHFINFYFPSCLPCQNLAAHWKRFAKMYQGIVKVAAINCHYHSTFCYETIEINSFPTLLFYPNGIHSDYIYYEGEDTFDALEEFMVKYIKTVINVPVISYLRSYEKPVTYILDSNIIEDGALTRMAYQLKDIATVVMIDDEELREDLTDDPDLTVIFQYKNIHIEISSSDERTIIKQILQSLPKVQDIGPEELKNIRIKLRSCATNPWVIYFPSEDDDLLLLHQLKIKFPNMNFGTIDCKSHKELCESLEIEYTPCWAMLKRGGAYQRAHTHPDTFIQNSADVFNLHTVTATEMDRILNDDVGTWVLLVVPYNVSLEYIADSFTDASKYYLPDYINFGIMECSLQTEHYCRIGFGQAAALVHEGRELHLYKGRIDSDHFTHFLQVHKDSVSVSLSEQEVLGIMTVSGRTHSWLVAYLPADCGRVCRGLLHEWRIVTRRLRPLQTVRAGVLQCTERRGLCANVLVPTARLYLLDNKQHYTLNLLQKSKVMYILEWVLDHLANSVVKLSWQSFTDQIVAQDSDPQMYKRPWLVYFQSPQCDYCFEKYPDFALASIFMGKVVNFGKVNCARERNLCQQEHISSQPALRLYLRKHYGFRKTSMKLTDYKIIMDELRLYLPTANYDGIFSGLYLTPEMLRFKHDEL